MYCHQTQIRIRYKDTDQMGFVYYGNYPTFYEIGRVEALRALGISYKELEEQGIMLPVVESHSRYLQPVKYDELIEVRTCIARLPGARIVFDYEIFSEGRLVHTGTTTLVCMRKDTERPCRMPDAILERLRPFFDAC